MTIQEAMAAAREMLPEGQITLQIEQTLRTGHRLDGLNKMTTERWIHHNSLRGGCVSSYRSWAHALAIVKSGNEDCWDEVEGEGAEEDDYRFAKDRDEWRHEAQEAQRLK